MPITKIFKKLIGRRDTSTGTPGKAIAPRKSPNPDRGVHVVDPKVEITEASEPLGFSDAPVVDVAPRSGRSSDDWVPRPPQDLDPVGARQLPRSHKTDFSAPPYLGHREAMQRPFGCRAPIPVGGVGTVLRSSVFRPTTSRPRASRGHF